MPEGRNVEGERALRVRFDADPASVPGARHFVAEGLRSWGFEDLVDDATLCVSELAGNAALHARSTYIEVAVLDLDRAVRLLVEDDGAAPLDALVPRTMLLEPAEDEHDPAGTTSVDELEGLLAAPTTGRGLAIVSVLASDWGIEQLDHGKRVWAELPSEPGPAHAPAPPQVDAGTGREAPGQLPEDWVTVRLAGCPVDLSLRQDQHLDELVRELTLISAGGVSREAGELADRLGAILQAPAHARTSGRRQAEAARARGKELVDVEMTMPPGFGSQIRRLHEAVGAADELCEQERLLTLASPVELRDLRAWMAEEIAAQVEHGAEPTSWQVWQRDTSRDA